MRNVKKYNHIRDQFTSVFGFDFLRKTRERKYVEARSAFYHYLYNYEKMTLNEVAEVIKLQSSWKPNHASILNALTNYDMYSFYNKKISEAVALVLGLNDYKDEHKTDFIKVAIDHCSAKVINEVHQQVTDSYEKERERLLQEEIELNQLQNN